MIATDIPDPAANTQHASNLCLDNTTFKFWCMMLARLTALALPASGHEVVWVTGSLLRSKHLTLVQIQGKDNKKMRFMEDDPTLYYETTKMLEYVCSWLDH